MRSATAAATPPAFSDPFSARSRPPVPGVGPRPGSRRFSLTPARTGACLTGSGIDPEPHGLTTKPQGCLGQCTSLSTPTHKSAGQRRITFQDHRTWQESGRSATDRDRTEQRDVVSGYCGKARGRQLIRSVTDRRHHLARTVGRLLRAHPPSRRTCASWPGVLVAAVAHRAAMAHREVRPKARRR
jgi:hypothetical protein